jgi:hypothetical protein
MHSKSLEKVYWGIWFKDSINLIKLCYEEITIIENEIILKFNKENMYLFIETYITDDLTKIYNQKIIYKFYNDNNICFTNEFFSIYKLLTYIDICKFKIDLMNRFEIITKYQLPIATCLHLHRTNEVVITFKNSNNSLTKENTKYMFDFYKQLCFIPDGMEVKIVNFDIPYNYYDCPCMKLQILKINNNDIINAIDKIDFSYNNEHINKIVVPYLIEKIEKIINKKLLINNEFELIDLHKDSQLNTLSVGINVQDNTILINSLTNTLFMFRIEIGEDKTIKFLVY